MTLLNPYVLIAALVLLIGAFGWGYVEGYDRADNSAQLESLKKDLAAERAAREALSRDRDKMQTLAALYKADADVAELELTKTREIANAFEQELSSRPGPPACRLTDRDVEWLRAIASGRALGAPPPPAGSSP